jgi:hypothetical protein
VKYSSTIELLALLADREWLDDVTKTNSACWRRKNERRKAAQADSPAAVEDAASGRR